MKHLALFAALLLGLASLTPSPPAEACATFAATPQPVPIAGEEALIVWDAARQTEHFIRRAYFRGAPADFGFVVPTPSEPTLTEMNDRVFEHLFEIMRVRDRTARGEGYGGRGVGAAGAAAAPARVEVVQHTVVAGLDATVLRATDAAALEAWLRRHGYPMTPQHRAWLAPYVAANHYVTAFRFAAGSARRAFASQSVRMTFRTERPFYPYSEPHHGTRRGRPLRVHVMASQRVRGQLTPPGGTATAPWIAPSYAGQAHNLRVAVRSFMPWDEVPDANTWLTTFHEASSVRGTSDLFFEADPDQTAVPSTIRSPVVTQPTRRARATGVIE